MNSINPKDFVLCKEHRLPIAKNNLGILTAASEAEIKQELDKQEKRNAVDPQEELETMLAFMNGESAPSYPSRKNKGDNRA